ncbi:CheR family methyltransferase [Acidithiobacillus acidisediminis]|uniref:CheR family methyltransferase n=1 Tax=Acidithiobacillus acidisediminis TaxID=2937799 RepID=UPI003D67C7E6
MLNSPLPDVGSLDRIWLLNVLIYFDLETKVQICQQIMQKLRPGGIFSWGTRKVYRAWCLAWNWYK